MEGAIVFRRKSAMETILFTLAILWLLTIILAIANFRSFHYLWSLYIPLSTLLELILSTIIIIGAIKKIALPGFNRFWFQANQRTFFLVGPILVSFFGSLIFLSLFMSNIQLGKIEQYMFGESAMFLIGLTLVGAALYYGTLRYGLDSFPEMWEHDIRNTFDDLHSLFVLTWFFISCFLFQVSDLSVGIFFLNVATVAVVIMSSINTFFYITNSKKKIYPHQFGRLHSNKFFCAIFIIAYCFQLIIMIVALLRITRISHGSTLISSIFIVIFSIIQFVAFNYGYLSYMKNKREKKKDVKTTIESPNKSNNMNIRRIKCPSCSTIFSTQTNQSGQSEVECPKCGKREKIRIN